ncbi:hypothetical protein AUC71_10545 [Methyloceanibacter marginalis]|uniref:Uncharacterized protein n=1 Tax=Methyloceanibacter marginalis TaxID=1774971 RepID=A0A1E3WBS7_9HYPH|nr:hypothetical protein [Methyloceanibacter marginalis]ODS03269.1 hypothetical protein AUC71_10545 [Methyloceanibacter marginalis]
MKTVAQQVQAMHRYWPGFELAEQTAEQAIWFGSLAGIERTYRIVVDYRLPLDQGDRSCRWQFPVVRVLSPSLDRGSTH